MSETLRGARVTLRRPIPSDKDDRLALGRHAEIVRMFGGDPNDLAPMAPAEAEAWYDALVAEPYSWTIEYKGRCIGTARLHSLNDEAKSARYAVGILDPALLGQGLGGEVTARVLAYAFATLGLNEVSLRVLAFNTRAIRSYEASGFRRIGVERNAVRVDGEWHDDVLMRIRREDWQTGAT